MSGKRKRCSFGSCQSSAARNIGLTFYSFPKDPVRRQKWIEMSGCTSPTSYSFLCELHFDDIYISKTPRRNTLLSSAVPQAIRDTSHSLKTTIPSIVSPPPEYTEDVQVEENKCFSDYIWNSAGELVKREITAQVEEEVQDESDYNNEEDSQVEDVNEEETMQLEETEEDNLEPIVINTNENSKSEDDLGQEQTIVPDIETPEKLCKNIPKTSIIEAPAAKAKKPQEKPSEIVTFIFNGEEFVQMPKRVYVAERYHLESQLRVYKDLISNLKSQLSSVKIDEI